MKGAHSWYITGIKSDCLADIIAAVSAAGLAELTVDLAQKAWRQPEICSLHFLMLHIYSFLQNLCFHLYGIPESRLYGASCLFGIP